MTEMVVSDTAMRNAALAELMAFRAPYVTDRLLAMRYVSSRDEGDALLHEALKYLWIGQSAREKKIPMFSVRVDEAWHQLALFTREYDELCRRVFGRFVHHAPSNAPPRDGWNQRPEASFEEFEALYRATFEMELPDTWRDGLTITLDRKLIVDDPESQLTLRRAGARLELVDEGRVESQVRMRVDDWAEAALRFVMAKRAFFVRELPGLLDADRVELCRALFRLGIVRVSR